jgi:hypothetical protein
MIEQDLDTLSNYGEPTLYQGSTISGIYWLCSIKMRVNNKSVTFEVKGKAETAAKACAECVKAMHEAIDDINKNALQKPSIGFNR